MEFLSGFFPPPKWPHSSNYSQHLIMCYLTPQGCSTTTASWTAAKPILFPLPEEIHEFPQPLIPPCYLGVDCSIAIVYFAVNIYLWMSTYCVCLSQAGLPHSGWLSSSSIYLRANFMRSLLLIHLCVNVLHLFIIYK